MPPVLTRPQSRPLPQTLLLGLVVLGMMMIVGLLWLEGYDQYVNALQISGQVAQGRGARSGQQVDSALNDSLLIFGFFAHPPCANGLGSSRDGTWRCSLETPLVCLLCLRCVDLSFRLRSAHCRCGLGPGVGSRDGHADELQSTPCVIRDDASRIAANIASAAREAQSAN